jgi:hypothetical protein
MNVVFREARLSFVFFEQIKSAMGRLDVGVGTISERIRDIDGL